MSSRHLRRLWEQKARELEKFEQEAAAAAPESESEAEVVTQKLRASIFALADMDEGNEESGKDETKAEAEVEDEVEEQAHAGVGEVEDKPVVMSLEGQKKKRKGKKKGRKKGKGKKDYGSKEPLKKENDEDEIERALRELDANDKKLGRQQPSTKKHSTKKPSELTTSSDPLFIIQPKHLKERNEMIAAFGREVIETMDNLNGPPRAPRRTEMMTVEDVLRAKPGEKLPDVTLKRNPFIDGKETWPRASVCGLGMERVAGLEGGVTEYAFTGDTEFREGQKGFFSLVQIGDSQSMIHALMQHPYQIMFLLQCFRIAKDIEKNAALAADLTQRALFTFGRVTLSAFRKDMERGTARLSARRPENRRFFLAGYRNVQALVLKGALRTAFEWAKLLFMLAPEEDPMGMHHVLHMLAVRSRNPEWLVAFVGRWEKEEGWPLRGELKYTRHSVVPALVQMGKNEMAEKLLVTRMQQMPWLYAALFQVLDLNAPPAIWGQMPPTDADKLLTEIYIRYSRELWSNLDMLTMLKRAATTADKDAKWTTINAAIDLRTCRFMYMEGDTELMGLLPAGSLNVEPNYDFDPLPPPMEENVFTHELEKIPWINSSQAKNSEWFNLGAVGDLARRLFGSGSGAFSGGEGSEEEDLDEELQRFLLEQSRWAGAVVENRMGDGEEEEGNYVSYGYRTPRVEDVENSGEE